MENNMLKTGILGLGEKANLLIEAAGNTGFYDIIAVADHNTKLLQTAATSIQCKVYDDFRQLIMQNELDCLLVAADIHSCDEHLRSAIKKKINILKLAPPARNFEEAAKFAQLAEQNDIVFVVANIQRYRKSYIAARQLILEKHIESIFVIDVLCSIAECQYPAWTSDPKIAGGGVLLYDCYDLIDTLGWILPLPQQVYALKSSQAQDKQQRLYRTEDTAIVSIKFNDSLIGNIIATRQNKSNPQVKKITFFSKLGKITVSENQLSILTSPEQKERKRRFKDNDSEAMLTICTKFAQTLLDPAEYAPQSTIAENLDNIAFLEATYLSTRTGFPEEPAKIKEMTFTQKA
jgi:predicted dehydrogenase